jgi:hypothetical protein
MGKKWKRLLVQRRAEAQATPPAPAEVSNSEMIEQLEAAVIVEPEAIEQEPVIEAPKVTKPKRKRRAPTRRKKSTSED